MFDLRILLSPVSKKGDFPCVRKQINYLVKV